MDYEVVVVGGGIGGLTVAALLAARGVNVCLLERASQPGGVIARVQSFGYTFDPGVGIYPFWEAGEIHDQIFKELPVSPPEVRAERLAYVVRLPDQTEIPLSADADEFEASLLSGFPECKEQALEFYRTCARLNEAALRPDSKLSGGFLQRLRGLGSSQKAEIDHARTTTAFKLLTDTSGRFRRFIDVQLQVLTQSSSATCSHLRAATALSIPRRTTYSILGGAPAIAAKLAESIKQSGGRIRYDTPVLRLAYDSNGKARGVDLLSGETVSASRAIVSNLTIWDTYGKLIGLNRTPTDIRKQLSGTRSWGAYVLFLGLDSSAVERLPADRILSVSDWRDQEESDPGISQLILAAGPPWDSRAPEGKRAATVLAFTDVDEWFTFHESAEEQETNEQTMLEKVWQRLHAGIPELGGDVELIETSTPLNCYELTRRKLGMVGTPNPLFNAEAGETFIENVFMVGDTNLACGGIASVSRSALALANNLTA
jgi:phytoene dehydrogenase-like protein